MKVVCKAAAIALLLAGSGFAARYALLVGAGQFPDTPGVHSLAGPRNDVQALRAELTKNWQIPDANIQLLMDTTAGKTSILAAIDKIVRVAKAGDVAVIYYSGHGTSASDTGTSGFGMSANTGAIVPADIKIGADVDEHGVLAQLIVGNTDLRPRFQALDDKGVQVLVIFDACYSGDSAKSIDLLVSRNADLLKGVGVRASADSAPKAADLASDGWPYRNVVYISAATRYEVAYDISEAMARSQRPTIDGKAHGAFTDALLRGLEGAADTNHDGQITYAELHAYLVSLLQRNGQTPQLHPSDKEIVGQPLLASTHAPSMVQPAAPVVTGLRVRLEKAEELRAGLSRIPEVRIVGGAAPGTKSLVPVGAAAGVYDLEIDGPGPAYRILYAGGTALMPGSAGASDVLRIIGKRARAQALMTLPFTKQDFNLNFTMIPDQGAYYAGDPINAQLKAERDCWLLVTDLDSDGNVILIYPHEASQFRLVKAGTIVSALAVEAQAPFGTEMIQALAFTEKPEGYDALANTVFMSDDQVSRLTAALLKSAAQPGRARTQRITFTAAKR